VAAAEAFQRSRFLQRRTDVAGDRERPGVVAAGPVAVAGCRQQIAQVLQYLSLAVPVAEVAEDAQCLLVCGGGEGVVSHLRMEDAELAEGGGRALPVTEVAVELQGLLLAGGSGRVVPRSAVAIRPDRTWRWPGRAGHRDHGASQTRGCETTA
jgi:hypothetical protein